MISTRTHGKIDYLAAAALGGLALSPGLSPRIRQACGTAALFHTGYSAVTDYEAGLLPRIGMRWHLRLDALAALALCGAGLAMTRHSGRQRLLLAGAGMAELAVVALSDSRPAGRVVTSYPPLDTLKPIADDLWIVDSVMGPDAPIRMTVVRLPGGDLLLHSPTRFDPGLRRELERLGRIRHLVAPNIGHWTFMKGWQDAVPGTLAWAAPGLPERGQVRRSELRFHGVLGPVPPTEWGDVIEHTIVPGGVGFHEVAMFHRPSRTLLLTDLVVNMEADKLPWLLRPVARLLGIVAPTGRAPAYLRGIVKLRRGPAGLAASRLVAWAPERVVFTHGRWFGRDGTAQLRRSLQWLLP